MNSVNPKVSIVLSTFRQEKYLRECIESILAQTFQDYELTVINDNYIPENKVDETTLIATRYWDKLVKVFATNNIGLSRTRNYGASIAKGEYLLFIDGDDKLDPTYLEKTVKVADENPNLAIFYTNTQHFDGADSHWDHPEYNFNMLLQGNFISSCSLIREKAFDEAGGFDEDNFSHFEDWEFWIRLGSMGHYGLHIPEKLFYYRIHPESGMQSKRVSMLSGVYRAYIISQFPELYNPDLVESSKNILSFYPDDFMKYTPKEQEEYLEIE